MAVKAPRTVREDEEAMPVNVMCPVAPRSCPVPPVIYPGEMNVTAVVAAGVGKVRRGAQIAWRVND